VAGGRGEGAKTTEKENTLAPLHYDLFCAIFLCSFSLYRVILEEELAPLVLDVEEESEHQDDVGEGDETDHHQPAVHRHPHLPTKTTVSIFAQKCENSRNSAKTSNLCHELLQISSKFGNFFTNFFVVKF
jgi:hypothetical protein